MYFTETIVPSYSSLRTLFQTRTRTESLVFFVSYPTSTRQSRRYCFYRCLSAFPDDISKTDAASITKLDTEMFYRECGKRIYFEVERSKVKVTRQYRCQSLAVGTIFLVGGQASCHPPPPLAPALSRGTKCTRVSF